MRPELLQWCEDFKMLSQLENFNFNFELEPGTYKIKVALPHFENAVNNLLDNAKKYAEDPIISLKTFAKKNAVFKKFYRVPEGDLHSVKGYGLRLNYVQ